MKSTEMELFKMILNNREINTSLLAISMAKNPKFHLLPDSEKESMGQAAFWWFSRIIEKLPENLSTDQLYSYYRDEVRDVAVQYLLGVLRRDVRKAEKLSDDELAKRLKTIDIDKQTGVFLRFTDIGLRALRDSRPLYCMADNIEDADWDSGLQLLLSEEK